jgi:hypothetical protein
MPRWTPLAALGPLAGALAAGTAGAQALPGPAPAPPSGEAGGAGALVGAGIVLAGLILIGVAVRLLDARRRREDEMAGLQGRLSDALLTDPVLAWFGITATVRTPLWPSRPAAVEIVGAVPEVALREAVRRLVAREVEHRHGGVRVEDRAMVDPRMARQRA